MLSAGWLTIHLAGALTLPTTRPLGVALADNPMPLWHGAGAEQWRRMRGIAPRGYACRRVNPARPVSLEEGDVRTASSWAHAPWTEDFVDIEGDRRAKPEWQTRVKMLWDDDALYVGAWMEEPCVVATLRERNSVIFHDNDFEVFIDPDASNHNYYELEVNALNTIWELRLDKPYKNGGSEHSERVGMKGQGNLPNLSTVVAVDGRINDASHTDVGWGIVAKIPFSDLIAAGHCTSPPAPLDAWRINFSRVQWKWEMAAREGGEDARWIKTPGADGGKQTENNWVWSPQGVVNMHCPERWGFVHFIGDDADAASTAKPSGGTVAGRVPHEGEAREALMAWHYLLQDWLASHDKQLPPNLDALQAEEAAALPAATEYGLEARPDMPGGYVAFVRLSPCCRLCVRGDALIWTDSG